MEEVQRLREILDDLKRSVEGRTEGGVPQEKINEIVAAYNDYNAANERMNEVQRLRLELSDLKASLATREIREIGLEELNQIIKTYTRINEANHRAALDARNNADLDIEELRNVLDESDVLWNEIRDFSEVAQTFEEKRAYLRSLHVRREELNSNKESYQNAIASLEELMEKVNDPDTKEFAATSIERWKDLIDKCDRELESIQGEIHTILKGGPLPNMKEFDFDKFIEEENARREIEEQEKAKKEAEEKEQQEKEQQEKEQQEKEQQEKEQQEKEQQENPERIIIDTNGPTPSTPQRGEGQPSEPSGPTSNPGSGDAGTSGAGTGDTGNSGAGSGDTGSGDAGTGDAGSGDAGTDDTGSDDATTDDGDDSNPGEDPEEDDMIHDPEEDLEREKTETEDKEKGKKPKKPKVKGNKPKLTWKTAVAVAAGIGIGATVFFTAGPLGVTVMSMAGGISNMIIHNKMSKLNRLGGEAQVTEVQEPRPGIKGAFDKFKKYIKSEEGLRDISWMINSALITGSALSIASKLELGSKFRSLTSGSEPAPIQNSADVVRNPVQPTTPTQVTQTVSAPTQTVPTSPYDNIVLGDNVGGYNVSVGHMDSISAVAGENTKTLISQYVNGDSIFNRFAAINPDGTIAQIVNTDGLSLTEFCAKNGLDVSQIAVDVSNAEGVGQAWINASELINGVGGPTL